ncbi:hypothetical protein MHYP_G00223510 [Metynnis hypsauchen]
MLNLLRANHQHLLHQCYCLSLSLTKISPVLLRYLEMIQPPRAIHQCHCMSLNLSRSLPAPVHLMQLVIHLRRASLHHLHRLQQWHLLHLSHHLSLKQTQHLQARVCLSRHLEVWHLLRADQNHLPRLHRWHSLHLSQHSSCLPPPRALLSTYFAMRSSNFPLRLSALRQAFTLVLSNSHHAKYISIAGRVLLGGLAARNARELPAFQEAYATLVAFAQDASHREAICTELAQVGIQHFNFLDIVFELVLLGVLQGERPPIYPVKESIHSQTPGGFLGHLVDMICSFSPVSMQRRPRAEQYLFLLQDEAVLLLEEIFGREGHCYMDPGYLALSLWDCLQTHVQQLLARLHVV